MLNYLIWIPCLIVCTVVWALIGKYVNTYPNSSAFFFLFLSIPVWPFVSRISKNLLFDGLLYDFILTLFYALTFIFLGEAKGFVFVNYIGIFLVIMGILLIKV